uniref:BED-type domain-containing protein n=1 Tax=Amphimedon queenslandica TaxID=400682 RepID=A0A1X7U849_AMPQE
MATAAGVGSKRCPVWKFFKYFKEENKTLCLVVTSSDDGTEKVSVKEFKGQFPTKLKKHLKSQHAAEYKALEMEEKMNGTTKKAKPGSQMAITDAFHPATKSWLYLLGGTNVPLSLVDCPEFVELLKELDPRYNVPQRKKLSREIDQVYQCLKDKLKSTISDSQKISLCADIWTKPGMSAAFLGVTSHFYSSTNKKHHQIILAVWRFPSPDTGERIADLMHHIVTEWDIPMSEIFRVIIDNGSNMVAALKQQSI